jgi:polyisoprenoid-binding protein YceI
MRERRSAVRTHEDLGVEMQAQAGQMAAPAPQALLGGGALAGKWVLDASESTIRLRSGIFGGLANAKGVFREASGHGTVTQEGKVSGALTISAASIDTKNTRRDTHLRSADFFDVASAPDITYAVEAVRPSDHGLRVVGALTVRDCSRPLSFEAEVAVPDDHEIWLDAELDVNRADFGLTWNFLGAVSKKSTLAIHAVFARQ